jgi:hypothetical protein
LEIFLAITTPKFLAFRGTLSGIVAFAAAFRFILKKKFTYKTKKKECINEAGTGVTAHDPFLGKFLSGMICSPICAIKYHQKAKETFELWKKLTHKGGDY